jgi:hypothetical protein
MPASRIALETEDNDQLESDDLYLMIYRGFCVSLFVRQKKTKTKSRLSSFL